MNIVIVKTKINCTYVMSCKVMTLKAMTLTTIIWIFLENSLQTHASSILCKQLIIDQVLREVSSLLSFEFVNCSKFGDWFTFLGVALKSVKLFFIVLESFITLGQYLQVVILIHDYHPMIQSDVKPSNRL